MNKLLLVSCMAVGLSLASAGLETAQAQFGYGGHHHHHGGYVAAPHCGYSPSIYGRGGYGMGYWPYGLSGYGSYYATPGLSISRGSYYSGRLGGLSVSPYGLGGYGNVGYLSHQPGSLPRVQLRIGF